MESLYFLIPLSFAVVLLGVAVFFWAVKSGQYDDLDGEAERILFERRSEHRSPTNTLKEEADSKAVSDSHD